MKLFTNERGFDRIRARDGVVTSTAALTTPSYEEQGMADSQPIHAHAAPQPLPEGYTDLTGRVYGHWSVVAYAGFRERPSGNKTLWLCRCVCGTEKPVVGKSLVSGQSLSCGCFRRERKRITNRLAAKTTCFNHDHDLYLIWAGMHQRCANPKRTGFDRYGGRGITVCERWNSFEAFLADMGERPSKKHSLDRYPDNDGNYEPGNCRWATAVEQGNNTRVNHRLTFNGETKTMTEWATERGIGVRTLWYRLSIGWSADRAMTTPVRGPAAPKEAKPPRYQVLDEARVLALHAKGYSNRAIGRELGTTHTRVAAFLAKHNVGRLPAPEPIPQEYIDSQRKFGART